MIFADKALLPDGWAKNVGIEIWGGLIGSIAKDVQPKSGDTHVSALVAGMPNVHSHAFQRGHSGLTEIRGAGRESFWTWREMMYRFALSVSPDDVAALAEMAYVEMLRRDRSRVADCRRRLNECPLGSAALAGTGFPVDREMTARALGFDAPTLESDDRFALEILHAVLSGQGGRLFYELRDKQSLAYSVYASMLLGVEASTFAVNIGTSPEKIEQAIRGMIGEIKRLGTEPPTQDEIASAKRYLIGNHDIGLQRNSARAMSVALDELYGLGRGRSFEYGDRIDAVTREEIEAVVARYLRIEDMLVSVTKPEAVEVSSTLLDTI